MQPLYLLDLNLMLMLFARDSNTQGYHARLLVYPSSELGQTPVRLFVYPNSELGQTHARLLVYQE